MSKTAAVLHVTSAIGGADGMSWSVWSIVQALRSYTSIDATLLAQHGRVPDGGDRGGIHIVRSTGRPPGILELVGSTSGLIRQLAKLAGEADLAHLHGLWRPTTLLGGPLLRAQGKPYVLSPHGLLMAEALNRRRRRKLAALRVAELTNLRRAHALIASSDAEAAAIEALAPQARIYVLPHPLDRGVEEFFAKRRPEEPSSDERVLLSVSRIHPIKRIEALVDAFADLAGTFPRWNLVVVGPAEDATYSRQLRDQVARRGVAGRIRFSGPKSGAALWEMYSSAHLFVLASRSENFGRVVAESLAAGLPAIATMGTPWRLLETDDCGWWVEPTTPALREGLRVAMEASDQRRSEMGQHGKRIAYQEFSGWKVAQRLAEVYDSLLRT